MWYSNSLLVLTLLHIVHSANILILHPVYSGSHEFLLRHLGEHLANKRGHKVTQVIYKHTQMKKRAQTNVDLMALTLKDGNKLCPKYINPDGYFDIKGGAAKILWEQGESLSNLPLDMFCLTEAQCETLFNVSMC